jgi:hypothetical protein
MDIVQAVSGYITKMVSVGDNATAGTSAAKMKILLLDNETVGLSAPPGWLGRSTHKIAGLYSVHRNDAVRPSEP